MAFPLGTRSRHLAPLVLALVGLGGCTLPIRDEPIGHTSQAVTVCAAGSVVQGVDVSDFQGTINWPDVSAAGIDFAIARISDGTDLDTDFATNWSGMQSAGLVRGAYQYFEPGEDPTTQANIVISAVGTLGSGDLPVTADMEATGGQSPATIAANLQTWATAVQAGTGKVPMIYTAEGYWDSDVSSTAFANDPLWVANWDVTCPDLATGWSNWVIWQYSDSGTVNGISDTVDLDEFNGTLAQLQAFAGGATASDAGGGYYGAEYVSQSWPLATSALMMTTCQTLPSSITLKNVGTKPWDSNTRLGTTEPRDRVSDFADSTWISVDRAAQVSGTVAPGDTFEFKFDFHAPPTAGTYAEYFGVVEDGVAWFGDPGQGGPPDNDIEANILVSAGPTDCTVDPGVPDGSTATSDGGDREDAAGQDAGEADGSLSPDAGIDEDSGEPGSGVSNNKGCACDAAGDRRGPGTALWAFIAIVLVLTRSGRRRNGKR